MRERGEPTKQIRWIIKKFEVDSQEIRVRLIHDLEDLMQRAVKQGRGAIKDGKRKTKHMREWSRLATYISQTINSILREYDEKQVKERLEEIEQRLDALARIRAVET